ncbi:hypothetical protein TCAL_02962 [Tigriopus californicus]|uniref:GPI transamidase component PIG-T n=1 Tax=Tigriopus californicus TaxID=6832 RepID=A0A553PTH4_TIGCA|nr:GPI transamidase component PIG-T-like [Tigriopus californicus]TRY80979.1 hypothetical protein TCAL_02962 [Tigriopus californicus]|eukprot:TCALIF_02962-PA protein Name:"Similar to Pigt GPI transamidase component PIG-T (Mus musculus)" AED:0.02 eAED:0.02 QI:292/1/1/1/1/1/3/166/637
MPAGRPLPSAGQGTPGPCLLAALMGVTLWAAGQAATVPSGSTESFHEEALFKPLANGQVLVHFRFTTLKADPGQDAAGRHFRLFPRSMAELMAAHDLRELDLSLSRGVWREAAMGYHPRLWGSPPGARVQAWFEPESPPAPDHVVQADSVARRWDRLTNALSGQLCASLNFFDATSTLCPRFSFQPAGISPLDHPWENNASAHFQLGYLPRENVCTENLTPWKKLLPCQSKRGLASLLHAAPIHRTNHHSLGLSLRHVCPSGVAHCSHPLLELVQDVTLVFRPHQMPENARDDSASAWSIRSLFGIGLTSACPMAESSQLLFDVTDDLYHLQWPEGVPDRVYEADGRRVRAVHLDHLLERGSSNVIANYRQPVIYGLIPAPRLHAHRYVVGHGQAQGGIVTKITNRHSEPLAVVFLDVIPWYLRTYFHTLRIQTDQGMTIRPHRVDFSPARDRDRPYVLEVVLTLPPQSVSQISIDFEKSILKWLEYPPDANHGFYVSSALITAVLPDRRNFTHIGRYYSTYDQWLESFSITSSNASTAEPRSDRVVRIFTESLLINLPTPDFSMPYNVICLACTVVALAFGPLHNITTKDLRLDVGPEPEGIVQRVKAKVTGILGRSQPLSPPTPAETDPTLEERQ